MPICPILKSTPLFSTAPSFSKNFSALRSVLKKWWTVNYHSIPSQLSSRIHPLIFLWSPKGVYLCKIFLELFSETCISHHCGNVSNSWCYDYQKIHICDTKNWFFSFLLMTPNETVTKVLIITTSRRKRVPISPNSLFWKSVFP